MTESRHIVIASTGSLPSYQDCKIVGENDIFPAIYSKVFGPAGKAECEAWVKDNCGK